jgi:hypothetical protein
MSINQNLKEIRSNFLRFENERNQHDEPIILQTFDKNFNFPTIRHIAIVYGFQNTSNRKYIYSKLQAIKPTINNKFDDQFIDYEYIDQNLSFFQCYHNTTPVILLYNS